VIQGERKEGFKREEEKGASRLKVRDMLCITSYTGILKNIMFWNLEP
jgi:hypothetical protein